MHGWEQVPASKRMQNLMPDGIKIEAFKTHDYPATQQLLYCFIDTEVSPNRHVSINVDRTYCEHEYMSETSLKDWLIDPIIAALRPI